MGALPYSLNEVLILDCAPWHEHLIICLLMENLVHQLSLRLGAREGLLLPTFDDLQLLGLGGVDVCAGLLSVLSIFLARVRRPGVHLLMF